MEEAKRVRFLLWIGMIIGACCLAAVATFLGRLAKAENSPAISIPNYQLIAHEAAKTAEEKLPPDPKSSPAVSPSSTQKPPQVDRPLGDTKNNSRGLKVKKFVVDIANQHIYVHWSNDELETLPISSGRSVHPDGRPAVNRQGIPLNEYRSNYQIVDKDEHNTYGTGDNGEEVEMPFALLLNDAGGRHGIYIHEGDTTQPYASHGCFRIPWGTGKKIFEATPAGTPVEIINR